MKNKFLKLIIFTSIIFSFFLREDLNAENKFEINSLDVEMNVNKDGTYDVIEKYEVNFIDPSLGLYRDLVSKYDMTFESASGSVERKQYYFPISNIEVFGDVSYIESMSQGKRIVTGPDNGPRFTGLKEYVFKYTVNTQALNLKEQKEAFFQNLVSGWNAPIHNFNAKVNFIQDTDLSSLIVKGETTLGEIIPDCIVEVNSFTCSYNETINFGSVNNGITAQVLLPDDYFSRANLNNTYIIFIIIAISLVAITVILKARYGVRLPIIEKIGFYPPKGYNSPMVGYIDSERSKNDHIYSLIFEWANKGFIRIEDDEEELKFYKVKDIESDITFEKTLFNKMFTNDEAVTTDIWAKNNLYNDVLKANMSVAKAISQKGKIYSTKSSVISNNLVMISIILLGIFNYFVLHFYTKSALAIIIAILISFINLIIFASINVILKTYVKDNKIIKSYLTVLLMTFISLTISFVITQILASIYFFTMNYLFYLSISFIFTFNIALSMLIKVRTQYGTDITGEVKGLKTFIKYAKYDELVVMQNENPYLYYDVLPYAQVFGMSNLWLDHFKEIEIPEVPYYTSYRSTPLSNYMLMRSFTNSMQNMSRNIMPEIKTGTGGSFSGGGGFSGGGFSGGGGFGGGGGGSR